MLQDYHITIATETDRIISDIKSRNCLLNDPLIAYPQDIDYIRQFARYHYWSNCESINVFQVIGTSYPDYIGVSSIDMLRVGKWMPLNLDLLARNPQYYFESTKKEPVMHYTKIDDAIYISGEGNHRTAIAKVLFYFTGHQILHGIEFNEYIINWSMIQLYNEIKENILKKALPVDIRVVQELFRREDTAGWKKDYFNLRFALKNYKTGHTVEVSENEAGELLKELIKGKPLFMLSGKNNYKNFLYGK